MKSQPDFCLNPWFVLSHYNPSNHQILDDNILPLRSNFLHILWSVLVIFSFCFLVPSVFEDDLNDRLNINNAFGIVKDSEPPNAQELDKILLRCTFFIEHLLTDYKSTLQKVSINFLPPHRQIRMKATFWIAVPGMDALTSFTGCGYCAIYVKK